MRDRRRVVGVLGRPHDGGRAGQEAGVTAVVRGVVAPTWQMSALRFADPTRVVARAEADGAH